MFLCKSKAVIKKQEQHLETKRMDLNELKECRLSGWNVGYLDVLRKLQRSTVQPGTELSGQSGRRKASRSQQLFFFSLMCREQVLFPKGQLHRPSIPHKDFKLNS